MSMLPTVALSVVLASAAAAAVSLALRPDTDVAPAFDGAGLQAELTSLREQQAALVRQVEQLRTAPVVAAPASLAAERVAATLDQAQIATAVEAYLKQRKEGGAGAADAASAGFDLEIDFAQLGGTNYWERPDLWKKAFAAGAMDEVIAKFEALAKANPKDIPTQMNLASAYMAYLQLDQSKWQYSMKADEVYDRVLAIDDRHWEARFTKAMSYTFWPEFTGKRQDAITHFETLVQQQETMPIEPHQAETYLFLGNLLQERDPKRAKEIWSRGLQRHPQHGELAKKAGQ